MLLFTSLEGKAGGSPPPPLPTTNDLIVLVNSAAPTSTGNQDITSAAFNGDVPVGAVIFWEIFGPASNHYYGYGAADGTTQWAAGVGLQSAAGIHFDINHFTSEFRDDCCVGSPDYLGGGSSFVRGNLVSFIADGIRIDWTNVPSLPANTVKLAVVLFGGVNCRVECGVVSGPATGGSAVSTSFLPKVVLAASAGTPLSTQTTDVAPLSFGVSDGTQQRGYAGGNDATFVDKHTTALFASGTVGKDDGTGLIYDVSIDGFSPSGFAMTASSSAGTDAVGWLSLSFGSIGHFHVDDWSFPTDFSGAPLDLVATPFVPDFGWIIGGQLYDGDPPGAADVLQTFSAVVFDGTSFVSVAVSTGVGSTTGTGSDYSTASWHWSNYSYMVGPNPFVGFTAGGWSFDASSGGEFNQDLGYLAIDLARTYAP